MNQTISALLWIESIDWRKRGLVFVLSPQIHIVVQCANTKKKTVKEFVKTKRQTNRNSDYVKIRIKYESVYENFD